MSKKLSVKISPTGEVTVLPTGFGSSCTQVSDIFKSLGELKSEEDTEELYESKEEEVEEEKS